MSIITTLLVTAAVTPGPGVGASLDATVAALQQAPGQGRQRGQGVPGGPGGQTPPGSQQQQPPKPVDFETAVKDFTKKEGVLNTYLKDETLQFEIPTSLLGRDFLWLTNIKESPRGGYNGSDAGERIVRFEQRGDKVLLRLVDYSIVATGEGADAAVAVKQGNVMPVVAALDVKAKSKTGGLLVDVTRLYKTDVPELSAKGSLGGGNMDANRTFLEKVNVFKSNVNVEIFATFTSGGGQPAGGGRRGGFGAVGGGPSNTAVVSHSLVLLPEKPMMGRLYDSRVPLFATGFQDYGISKLGVKSYEFVSRHRLEKKDPDAKMSDPVKPIIFYLGREVPRKWRAAIKAGVEDWNVAFEAAGFTNAIKCLDAPSEKEDPNWSAEDANTNVIRWAALPIANAVGPSTIDPRSGEVMSNHIIFWHDILKLQTQWYFTQASPSDPRSQRLPLPDDVMEKCLEFVAAHEVGHTLGFVHNGKSSSTVPIKLLRDPKWTAANGTCPSIMDYARFNYVAQPGDGAALIPKVGIYDKYAAMWAYTPIPHATNPWMEKQTLDLWAARQVDEPMLRARNGFASYDPSALSEALGDDAIEASRLGLLNLKRVMGYIEPATVRLGEDFEDLSETYGAVFGQLRNYVGHVSANVGGVVETNYLGGRGGDTYTHVAKDYQKRSAKWVMDTTFETQGWLVPRSITQKLGPTEILNRVKGLQSQGVNSLLQTARMTRMLDNEALNGGSAYSVAELMADVRANVWRELSAPKVSVDVFRRSLQRTYVNTLVAKLPSTASDIRGYATGELKLSQELLKRAASRAADQATLDHIQDLQQVIEMALTHPAPEAPANAGFFFLNGIEEPKDNDGCDMFSEPVGWHLSKSGR
ncbi:MAG: zinc-dependent metalloprotease [Armatimonadetes bacterium]|nr:zinc-dependent metalloprotease [Armatimonadota bacterium]